jgi:hypothetical protein
MNSHFFGYNDSTGIHIVIVPKVVFFRFYASLRRLPSFGRSGKGLVVRLYVMLGEPN